MGKRGPKREDLIGQKFGKLLVIDRADDKKGRSAWLCRCDCGNEKIITGQHLKSGAIISCGCAPGGSKERKKFNTYDFSNEYAIGYDDKGNEFYFDKEDYETISQYYWALNPYGYFVTHLPRNQQKQRAILMHRLLMNPPDNMEVDHINHRRNDNRKSNLRICTHFENMQNVTGRKKALGISAMYYITGHPELGMFDTKEEVKEALQNFIVE